jgi:hypothetical protein
VHWNDRGLLSIGSLSLTLMRARTGADGIATPAQLPQGPQTWHASARFWRSTSCGAPILANNEVMMARANTVCRFVSIEISPSFVVRVMAKPRLASTIVNPETDLRVAPDSTLLLTIQSLFLVKQSG